MSSVEWLLDNNYSNCTGMIRMAGVKFIVKKVTFSALKGKTNVGIVFKHPLGNSIDVWIQFHVIQFLSVINLLPVNICLLVHQVSLTLDLRSCTYWSNSKQLGHRHMFLPHWKLLLLNVFHAFSIHAMDQVRLNTKWSCFHTMEKMLLAHRQIMISMGILRNWWAKIPVAHPDLIPACKIASFYSRCFFIILFYFLS